MLRFANWFWALGILFGSACSDEAAQPAKPSDAGRLGPTADVEVTGHIFKATQLPSPDVSELQVPAGFVVTKAAEGLGNARMLVVADDGTIYVTRRDEGDVLMLKDDGHGALSAPTRAASRPGVHGLAIHDGRAYLATVHEIFRAEVLVDGTFGEPEMIISDLPDAGQHNTRTVQVGPDNLLYISVGSTCNECNEPNQENATIVRASLDGKQRAVWASGLRDTIGWGWQPQTGELWGMDQGMDWLGDEIPPEELNRIERGRRYGWPFFWGDNQVNPHLDPPAGLSKAEWQKSSVPMVLGYTSHAAAMQLSFYNGAQFPEEYRGDAFVSMHGSWNRKPASGYEVVRIHFESGQPKSIEPFITGFITAQGESGRPCGNAVDQEGALLFTDDRNGVLYRVSYTGTPNRLPPSIIPDGPMLEQAERGNGVPIAFERPETAADGSLDVRSPAFADGAEIPAEYSEYEQGASFPLEWSDGPSGTGSYLLLVEDPDAATPTPFVHWLAWNIPADATTLREGLPEQDLLTDPPGVRQGVSSRGTIGYVGPRPPAGDPDHHYHVQIFALDQRLDLPITGADRDQVLAAASRHVLARGQLVGKFKRPTGQVSRP